MVNSSIQLRYLQKMLQVISAPWVLPEEETGDTRTVGAEDRLGSGQVGVFHLIIYFVH